MPKANSYYVPKGLPQSSTQPSPTNGNGNGNGNGKNDQNQGNRIRSTSFDQFITSTDLSTQHECHYGDDLGYLCRRILSGEDIRNESFGYRQLFGKSLVKPSVTNITPYEVSKSLGNFVLKMIQKSCQENNYEISSNKFKLFERKPMVKTSSLQQKIATIGESLSTRFSVRQSAHISPEESSDKSPPPPLPAIETLTQFIYEICYSTQMEYECSVVSLIYLTRFMEVSYHKTQLNEYNWRSVVLSCMLIANKMWDDFHVSNVSYCSIFPGLTLERVNQLEIGLLTVLDFNTWVSPSQYAEKHFSIQACIAEEQIKQLKEIELAAQKNLEVKLTSPSRSRGSSSSPTSTTPVSVPHAAAPTPLLAAAANTNQSLSSEKITIRTVESQSVSRYHFEKREIIAQNNIKIDEHPVEELSENNPSPLRVSANSIEILSHHPSQSIPGGTANSPPSQLMSNKANEICQFIDRTRKTLMKTSHTHLLVDPGMPSNQTFFSCLPFLCHSFYIFKDKI